MNGVLVDTQLEKMIAAGQIRASDPIDPDQIQPNSIDLRVGRTAYRVRASFLPTRGTVQDKLIGGLSLAPELPRPRGSEDGEKPQTRRLEALDGIAPFDPTNVCLRRAGDLGLSLIHI